MLQVPAGTRVTCPHCLAFLGVFSETLVAGDPFDHVVDCVHNDLDLFKAGAPIRISCPACGEEVNLLDEILHLFKEV